MIFFPKSGDHEVLMKHHHNLQNIIEDQVVLSFGSLRLCHRAYSQYSYSVSSSEIVTNDQKQIARGMMH